MSWSSGVDKYGKLVGYSIETKCEHEDCNKIINKSLGCRCGGVSNLSDDFGCGSFFCDQHLFLGYKDQLCKKCYKEMEKNERT